MSEVKRMIYVSWAFKENEADKSKMNNTIYKEDYKDKSKRFYTDEPTKEELKTLTCYRHVGTGYGHSKYKILSNPHDLKRDELALICDSGNLCFGYRNEGNLIVIHTD